MKVLKSSIAWLIGAAPIGVLFWPMYVALFSVYVAGSARTATSSGTLLAGAMVLLGLIGHAAVLLVRDKSVPLIGAMAAGFGFSAVMLLATTALAFLPAFLGPAMPMSRATFHSVFAPVVMLPLAFLIGLIPSVALGEQGRKTR